MATVISANRATARTDLNLVVMTLPSPEMPFSSACPCSFRLTLVSSTDQGPARAADLGGLPHASDAARSGQLRGLHVVKPRGSLDATLGHRAVVGERNACHCWETGHEQKREDNGSLHRDHLPPLTMC